MASPDPIDDLTLDDPLAPKKPKIPAIPGMKSTGQEPTTGPPLQPVKTDTPPLPPTGTTNPVSPYSPPVGPAQPDPGTHKATFDAMQGMLGKDQPTTSMITGIAPGQTTAPTPTPAPTTPAAPATPPATIGQLTPTPGSGATQIDPLRDPNAIRKAIDDAAKAQGRPGATEQDIAYWTQKILANGGLTQYWLDRLAHGGDPAQPAAPTGSPSDPFQGQYSQQIHDQIARLLANGNAPVTGDDPSIRAQFDPVSASLQRGSQRTKAAAAEAAAFQGSSVGGAGGSLDATRNSINEDTSNQEGTLMSQFIGQEIQARRQDVVNALQFAQGEEKMQLEAQLAQMNDALQRLQLSQQNQQFYDNYGLRLGEDQYNYNQGYNNA